MQRYSQGLYFNVKCNPKIDYFGTAYLHVCLGTPGLDFGLDRQNKRLGNDGSQPHSLCDWDLSVTTCLSLICHAPTT